DVRAQNRARDAWARRIWEKMAEELSDIFANCEGFEAVTDADGFAAYIKRHQVETTMPFNDYWLKLPNFGTLPVIPLLGAIAVPLLVTVLALATLLLGGSVLPMFGWSAPASFWLGAIATGLAAVLAVRYVNANGQKPLPPGQYADLSSVLKSLYLQETFTEFAIAQQGASDADLHAAFGRYLEDHRPLDPDGPTQAPGVISITRPGGTVSAEG
ncbi:MAG: hypothetical protein AAFQ51_15030, partial [Pseudomonadota bacterium]